MKKNPVSIYLSTITFLKMTQSNLEAGLPCFTNIYSKTCFDRIDKQINNVWRICELGEKN